MSWRDDLALFGINVPERIPLEEWAVSLKDKPAQNTLVLLGLSTIAFYAAERNRNPKVNDIWDSLVYCSTCLSVGYGDIFARTPAGKILGSLLMTVGPALSGQALDGHPHSTAAHQEEILSLLRQILAQLQSQPTR